EVRVEQELVKVGDCLRQGEPRRVGIVARNARRYGAPVLRALDRREQVRSFKIDQALTDFLESSVFESGDDGGPFLPGHGMELQSQGFVFLGKESVIELAFEVGRCGRLLARGPEGANQAAAQGGMVPQVAGPARQFAGWELRRDGNRGSIFNR